MVHERVAVQRFSSCLEYTSARATSHGLCRRKSPLLRGYRRAAGSSPISSCVIDPQPDFALPASCVSCSACSRAPVQLLVRSLLLFLSPLLRAALVLSFDLRRLDQPRDRFHTCSCSRWRLPRPPRRPRTASTRRRSISLAGPSRTRLSPKSTSKSQFSALFPRSRGLSF